MHELAAGALAVMLLGGSVSSLSDSRPHIELSDVDESTVIVIDTPFAYAETPNADEARPGLSIVKLYMADYALRHGDGNDSDIDLAEIAVTSSDDGAAEQLYRQYPRAIDEIADEYDLEHTHGGGYWGDAMTSPRDVVTFLSTLKRVEPDSKILKWMEDHETQASDGTLQNWGTHLLPGARGSKWGWSDHGARNVASATVGDGFVAASHTYGRPGDQTEHVGSSSVKAVLERSGPPTGWDILRDPASEDITEWVVPTGDEKCVRDEETDHGGRTSDGGSGSNGRSADVELVRPIKTVSTQEPLAKTELPDVSLFCDLGPQLTSAPSPVESFLDELLPEE